MLRQHTPTSVLLFMSALALSVSLVIPVSRAQQETAKQGDKKIFSQDNQPVIPFDPQPISIFIDLELWDVGKHPAPMDMVAKCDRTTHHQYDGLDPPVHEISH